MKPFTDTDTPFDRASTREELFQVIELIGASKSAIAAHNTAVLTMLEATTREVSNEMAVQGSEGWSESNSDDELALAAEIQPLADFFLSNRQRIN